MACSPWQCDQQVPGIASMSTKRDQSALSDEKKLSLVSAYLDGYANVDELVGDAREEELDFRPPTPGSWTISEILVHLLDAEIIGGTRIRAAIAQPGIFVVEWDEEAWCDGLAYSRQGGRASLELAKRLRRFFGDGLEASLAKDWTRCFIQHPSKGILDLYALLDACERRIIFHLSLIRRNRREWFQSGR